VKLYPDFLHSDDEQNKARALLYNDTKNPETGMLAPYAIKGFGEMLERLQQEEAKRTEVQQPSPGTRVAQQAFGHLIGAPVGGAVIGWGLDSLVALSGHRTFPLFLLLMLFFGFGVGLRNVIRITDNRTTPGN
jgi:ATP synthase protein I